MRTILVLLLALNITFALVQWLLPYEVVFVEQRQLPDVPQLTLLAEFEKTQKVSASVPLPDQTIAENAESSEDEPINAEDESGLIKLQSEVDSEEDIFALEPTAVDDVAAKKGQPPRDKIADALGRIQNNEQAEPVKVASIDKLAIKLCYTVGPITDRERANEIMTRFRINQVETRLQTKQEKEYRGTMVFVGGHKTRADAQRTASALSARGLTEYAIVEKANQPYILSLGVFSQKDNVDEMMTRAAGLNFKVQAEARWRERTVFWLLNQQSAKIDVPQLLDRRDISDGISQIPAQCLPS